MVRMNQTRRQWMTRAWAVSFGMIWVLSSCAPSDSGDRQGPREFVVERERVRAVRRAMAGATSEQIVQLVKDSRVDEDGPTTGEWLAAQVSQRSLHVLFPRWETERVAPQKYEVTYIYTEIGGDDRIQRRGYHWAVDAVLGLVGPAYEFTAEELAERTGSTPLAGEEPIRLE